MDGILGLTNLSEFSKFSLVFIVMIAMHIVDDYYLQGILAKLKQKSWWEENAPDKMYKNDYIVGLIMHSFSWTFSIMLPCVIAFGYRWWFIFIFGMNVFTHAYTDDLKANRHEINLWDDQTVHILQIFVTLMIIGLATRVV